MLKRRVVTVFAILSCCAAIPAQAEFSDCDVSSAMSGNFTQLAEHYIRHCVANSEQAESFKLHIDRIQSRRGDARVSAVIDGLRAMEASTEELTNASRAGAEDFRRAVRCDIQQLGNQADAALDCPGTSQGLAALFEQKWEPERIEGASGIVFESSIVQPLLAAEGRCAAVDASDEGQCRETFNQQFLPILELHSIMHNQLVPASNDKAAAEVSRHYSVAHQQWKSYLSDTGFQYPWELTINKWRHGGFNEVARHKSAPKSRWIVMHPTAGIYYSDELVDGSDADLIAILKVIGYKHWSFDNETNKPKKVLGISLTSTAADLEGVDDLGVGVLLEYNQFSVGYSKHGSTGVYMLNIDLANVLSNKPESLPEWLEMLED